MTTYYDITGEMVVEDLDLFDQFRSAIYRSWLLTTMPVGITLDLGGTWARMEFTRIDQETWVITMGDKEFTCDIGDAMGILAVAVYKGAT